MYEKIAVIIWQFERDLSIRLIVSKNAEGMAKTVDPNQVYIWFGWTLTHFYCLVYHKTVTLANSVDRNKTLQFALNTELLEKKRLI